MNTCKACRFLHRSGGHGGDCRRYPPTVNASVGMDGPDWFYDWPGVINDDWCGEWRGSEMVSLKTLVFRWKGPKSDD